MPWSPAQKGLFGSDLRRKREGKATRTGMSEAELEKALHEPTKKKARHDGQKAGLEKV